MVRQVKLQDAKAIADIYNEYVVHSVATFDTEPVQEEEMRTRIAEISSSSLISFMRRTRKSSVIVMPIHGKSVLPTAIRRKRPFICLPGIPEKGSARS